MIYNKYRQYRLFKYRKIILIFLICLIYNFTINTFYRPYIYLNKINDFGIADIGNNITFIPGCYIFLYFFKKNFILSRKFDVWLYFGILSFIEILSAFLPHLVTCDIKDIIGLFLGALILYLFIISDKTLFID